MTEIVPTETLIDCGESLDIGHARALHARLLEACTQRTRIVLDAGAVRRADTAGLQLLAAFLRSARAAHLAYGWRNPSLVLRGAAQMLGLTRELDLPAP